MKSRGPVQKEAWLKDGLYKEISVSEGLSTIFRKFENGIWIAQFNEATGNQVGVVRIMEEDFKQMWYAPAITPGDGKTPQTLAGEKIGESESEKSGR
jgi:hypothetical protein